MLLRIRHLVVERGMAVAAAGNEILHEAEPGTADTKARLEALRSRLITLLLYNRAAGAGEPGVGDERRVSSAATESALSFPLVGDSLTVTPLIPSRRTPRQESPVNATPREIEFHYDSVESRPRIVHVPLSHLFVTSKPRETARTLRSILEKRLRVGDDDGIIIPAPAGAMEQYHDVFSSELEESEDGVSRVRVIPVFPVVSGSVRWWSPRMSLFIALATDAELERWMIARGVSTAYLWAPEDPSLPETVSGVWAAAAAAHPQGMAVAVEHRRKGIRLPDATVLNLPSWRPALSDILAVGRWRMGRARPEALATEVSPDSSGGWNGGWRFDLWQRDLLALAPPRVVLQPPRGPVPWYGEDWREEVAHIWGDLERNE
jgi:hypothetical protein